MTKHSKFRAWVHELWLQNCDEVDSYRIPKISQIEYFQRYKYWLKREYQHTVRVKNV
jgi:hypothetical protein